MRRSIWVADAEGIDFPHAAHVLRIRRDTMDHDGSLLAKEIVHGITTLDAVRGTPEAWRSVEDSAPGCFPGLRPLRPRSDRSLGLFLYGLSDDGGLDDAEESLPRRRSISATRPLSAAILASAASRAAPAAASCASLASMTSRSRALDARRVATRRGALPRQARAADRAQATMIRTFG